MARGENPKGRPLEIYDPRDHDRIFKLSDHDHWHSRGSDLVFFETEDYSRFSSARWVRAILVILCAESSGFKVHITVEPFRNSKVPDWLEEAQIQEQCLSGNFPMGQLEDACSFYESEANYGIWTFSRVKETVSGNDMSFRLPEILTTEEAVFFHLEIDLDGILIGCLRPQFSLDHSVQALRGM